MIIRIVKMTFVESEIPRFLELFEARKAEIRGFEGCTHVTLLQDTKNEHIFFTYSHWQTEEHLNNYRHSALFADIWPRTKALFSAKPEAWSTVQKTIVE